MLHIIAILLLLCNIPRVPGWAPNPGSSCDQCCCCVVVANKGTRNFYAQNGGSFLVNTIPNCYYLQTHLDSVLADWDAQSQWVEDADTLPGQYLYWMPTDPAYGCYNDFATVTATNFNGGPSTGVEPPSTSSNGGSGTTTSLRTSDTVSAATAPAKTVTAAPPVATSGQSLNAEMLQECAPGCGKSQCVFSNLPLTYPIIVGTPVENCDPNSNATISSAIGGSVQITNTWSVNSSLGVGFGVLSLHVEGSYSYSKTITYSQTITIQILPGQMVALIANVLYNRTSGNMEIGSMFPIISNQPQEVLSYGQQIKCCHHAEGEFFDDILWLVDSNICFDGVDIVKNASSNITSELLPGEIYFFF
ncbi:uncharacterized protein LACBIDRAFT_293809, partial [Laccaria bicolor S238N-H82]